MFPIFLTLSYRKNIPQIVIGNINNIKFMDFIFSSKKKMFWFVDDTLQTDTKKYDADCPITPLATKIRISICTRSTVTKVLDKLSGAVSTKRTPYNCRNGEATYLVLLTRYCSFDNQKNLFHCKTHFAWYKISVCFSFFVVGAFIEKYWFKLKSSISFLNFKTQF